MRMQGINTNHVDQVDKLVNCIDKLISIKDCFRKDFNMFTEEVHL